MKEQQVFIQADHTLKDIVDQIQDEQWDMPMPSDFPTRQVDHVITLREIINYHAYDDAWVPDMLAGHTMAEAGSDKFDGDLLGDDPKGNFAQIVEAACAAAAALPDNALNRTVHCSFGDFPAREYFWQINSFRALRAHDIAKVIGVNTTLPPTLVQGIWDEIAPVAESWRQIGVYGPEIAVPEDASLQDKLLGLTGRQPSATSTFSATTTL